MCSSEACISLPGTEFRHRAQLQYQDREPAAISGTGTGSHANAAERDTHTLYEPLGQPKAAMRSHHGEGCDVALDFSSGTAHGLGSVCRSGALLAAAVRVIGVVDLGHDVRNDSPFSVVLARVCCVPFAAVASQHTRLSDADEGRPPQDVEPEVLLIVVLGETHEVNPLQMRNVGEGGLTDADAIGTAPRRLHLHARPPCNGEQPHLAHEQAPAVHAARLHPPRGSAGLFSWRVSDHWLWAVRRRHREARQCPHLPFACPRTQRFNRRQQHLPPCRSLRFNRRQHRLPLCRRLRWRRRRQRLPPRRSRRRRQHQQP